MTEALRRNVTLTVVLQLTWTGLYQITSATRDIVNKAEQSDWSVGGQYELDCTQMLFLSSSISVFDGATWEEGKMYDS